MFVTRSYFDRKLNKKCQLFTINRLIDGVGVEKVYIQKTHGIYYANVTWD